MLRLGANKAARNYNYGLAVTMHRRCAPERSCVRLRLLTAGQSFTHADDCGVVIFALFIPVLKTRLCVETKEKKNPPLKKSGSLNV